MVKVRWENGHVAECKERVAEILIKKGRVSRMQEAPQEPGESARSNRVRKEKTGGEAKAEE